MPCVWPHHHQGVLLRRHLGSSTEHVPNLRVTVRLPMSKRKAMVADSSGASQPTAPGGKQSRVSSSASSQPAAPGQSGASRQAVEADNSGASQPAGAGKPADPLMQAIRTLGRLPKETRTATKDERQLALKLRRARRAGKLSGEEEAEPAAMSANDSLTPGCGSRQQRRFSACSSGKAC